MSESLSALMACLMACSGVVAAARAAARFADVADEMARAWRSEHEARLCAEAIALRRNLLDAAAVVSDAAPESRWATIARDASTNLIRDAMLVWPTNQTEVVDGDCVVGDGNTARARLEGELPSGGYPERWPRWATRWGRPPGPTGGG